MNDSPAQQAKSRAQSKRLGSQQSKNHWWRWGDPAYHPFTGGFILGLFFAAAMLIAFPSIRGWAALPVVLIAAWGAVVPALRTTRPAVTALGVALAAAPMWAWHHQWILLNHVTGPGFVGVIIYLSLWTFATVWLIARLQRRFGLLWAGAAAAVVWTGMCFFRGEIIFTGYPWYFLGQATIELELMRGWATLGGGYLLEFLVVLLAMIPILTRRLTIPAATAFFITALLVIMGGGRLLWDFAKPPGSDDSLRIAVVQTNVPQHNRAEWAVSLAQRVDNMRRFMDMTRAAAAVQPPPELIIWPETMYPGSVGLTPQAIAELEQFVEKEPGFRQLVGFPQAMLALQEYVEIPMLVGAAAYEDASLSVEEDYLVIDSSARHNSAFLIAAGQVQQRYDKISPTPFGERIPYVHHWPWLKNLVLSLGAADMAFDLTPGDGPAVLTLPRPHRPDITVATPICFEATMAEVCRDLVAAGEDRARLFINLTNDGWFGGYDPGRWMHLLLARWRTIELGLPMVRAANTGVSAVIDARGRVLELGTNLPGGEMPPVRQEGVLIAEVPLPPPNWQGTIYAHVGDVAGRAAAGATAILLLAALLPHRAARRRKAAARDAPA